MRIFFVPAVAGALLLAGCAFSTDVTVDPSGVVGTESTIEIPKATAARPPIEADNLQEWEAWLESPTGGEILGGLIGGIISNGSGDCVPGEDVDDFTVRCSATGGDVSGISASGLTFTRTGTTVVVTLAFGELTDVANLPLALVGIRASVTLPGTVTGVSGGAVQVDADTVSMDRWDATADTMTGTFTLSSDPGVEFPVDVSVGAPAAQTATRTWNVGVTTTPAENTQSGQVTLYTCPAADSALDACTQISSGRTGGAIYVDLLPGQHFIASRVQPDNWWAYDDSIGRTTVTVQSLRARIEPRIVGTPEPGKVLRVALGRWSPTPSVVHYRWVRVMTAQDGTGAEIRVRGGVGQGYRVTSADVGYTLKVRVTMRGPGVPPHSMWLTGPTIGS
jgi:hypothetical protein